MAKRRAARKRGREKKSVSGKAAASAAETAGKPAAKSAGKPARKKARKSPAKRARKAPAKRAGKSPAKRAGKASSQAAAGRKRARKRPAKKKAAGGEKLLTLTEVSKRTGISMPTLQRYKKEYQDRLETVGEGRTQRYKPSSLDTFRRIKKENLKKRGRPRKAAGAKPGAKAARAAGSGGTPEGLISLSEIGRRTGISYPTLLRYVRLHGDQIPSHGTGRKRRFPPSAVPVFRRLRKESRRGRRKGSAAKAAPAAPRGLEGRLRKLEASNAALERQVRKLVKALRKPVLR